jgi:hypothetical protein
MARKRTSTLRTEPTGVTDDFTRIHGIGPIHARHLQNIGIRTFAQLAQLSSEAVASLIPNLSRKQVSNQHWIRQARVFVSAKTNAGDREKEAIIPASRQHYENFTLEFLLGEKNKIRRTQIMHVQSRDVDTCPIWDVERLVDFLGRHTGARLSYTKAAALPAWGPKMASNSIMSTQQPTEVITKPIFIPTITKSEEHIDSIPPRTISESTASILASSDNLILKSIPQQTPLPTEAGSPINQIRLLEWKTLLGNTNQPLHNLPHDQTFDVDLTLDLANVSLANVSQLDFIALLYAKKLGNGHRQIIAETQDTVPYSNIVDLTIKNATLPQGLYRLESLLTLTPIGSSILTQPSINTSFQGGLFQIY